jgi:polyprenyl-phospho-N-acetylgalactosaminyl synthase
VKVSEEVNNGTWCIVPMYNEGLVVGDVIRDLKRVFTNVICVDDGSSDDSVRKARGEGALVIVLPINIGQGGALSAGFSFLKTVPDAKYVVTFDSDGQHDPKDAMSLLYHLHTNRLDIVFGTRFSTEVQSNVPRIKKYMLRSIALVNRIVNGSKLTDSHNGLRAMTVEVVDRFKLTQYGMAHASEFVSIALKNRLKYDEIPTTIRYTNYSKSKGQSLWNGVNIISDLYWR